MIRIAINGFGRIGRSFLRALVTDAHALEKIKIVALNVGNASLKTIAHSFTYDTLMGTFQGKAIVDGDYLVINDTMRIALVAECDAEKLPWKSMDIDWVVDCSGQFTCKKDAQKHQLAGARSVLISAPSKDADVSIIVGVNQHLFDAQKHTIVSLGSCTTNAVTPVLKVMQDAFSIISVAMTTVHAYTNNQVLLDVEQDDVRRSRAAALNIIPTTTGAMASVQQVLPELAGKMTGCSLRVPVAKVSLIDVALITEKKVTIESIHAALYAASNGSMQGVMCMSEELLVSSDYAGNGASVIIDTSMTAVVGSLSKIFGWYDNEWAYSVRLKDFLVLVSR